MNIFNFLVQWGIFFAIAGIIIVVILAVLVGLFRSMVWLVRNFRA